MSKFFKLDENKKVIPCEDVIEWGEMFEKADRHVAHDQIGCLRVSTVFIGINMNYLNENEPLVFETMVFKGGEDIDCWHYTNWDDALKKHKILVEQINNNSYKASKDDI